MTRLLNAIKEKIKGKPLSLRSPHWETVRKNHIKLEPSCAACGIKSHLQVHHKLPFHLHPELELVQSNLITLCEQAGDAGCHLKIGHLGDWKSFNPNVETDAKEKLLLTEKVSKMI
jgi:5-methylcytosine-specific restriction endonuclease McrA